MDCVSSPVVTGNIIVCFQETSFVQADDEKVQKLRVMFPTADEPIIKQFLIK